MKRSVIAVGWANAEIGAPVSTPVTSPSFSFAVLGGGLADFFFEADAEFAGGGEAAGVGDVADAFPGMAEEAFGEVEAHVEQFLIGALAEVFFEEVFEIASGGGAVAGEFVDVDGLVEVLFEPLQGAGHGGVGGVIVGRGFIAVDAGGGEAAVEAAGEVVLLKAAGEFLHGAAAEGFGIGQDAAEAAGGEEGRRPRRPAASKQVGMGSALRGMELRIKHLRVVLP